MSCPFCLPTGERGNKCLHRLTVEEYADPKRAVHRTTERMAALKWWIGRLNENRPYWNQRDIDLYKRLALEFRQEAKHRLTLIQTVLCGHRPRAS